MPGSNWTFDAAATERNERPSTKSVMKHSTVLILMCLLFAACSRDKDQGPDNTPTSANLNGLHVVNGRYLADGAQNKVILRGVNMGSLWSDGLGINELPEIEKTGANAVRLVLQTESDNSNIAPMTAAQIEPMILYCLGKKMIPVLVWYGATGTGNSADGLNKAVDWWRSKDMKALLLKYQRSIIVNIANEPADETVSEERYTEASINAIKAMRRAGFGCPFMIDAPNWGHDAAFFVRKGPALMEADPLHNLVFSVHAYWTVNGGAGSYSDADIAGFLTNLAAANLPVVVGEVAWGLEQDGKDMTDYRNYDAINYRLILKLCGEKDLGYLVWQWGFINPAGSGNAGCMTTNGTFGGLTSPGREFAVTLPYSIKNTAKRAVLN